MQRLSDAGFARRVLIALGVAVLLLLLWRIVDALLLAFGAVLVAVLLRAAALPLARRTPLPEWSTIPLVALLIAAGFGLVAWLVGAEVQAQASELARRVPPAWEALQESLAGSGLGAQVADRVGSAAPDVGGVLAGITGMASSAVGLLGNLVLVIFGGLYLAAQPRTYRKGLVMLVPPKAQASVGGTLDACGEALRRWLSGQLLSMAVAASSVVDLVLDPRRGSKTGHYVASRGREDEACHEVLSRTCGDPHRLLAEPMVRAMVLAAPAPSAAGWHVLACPGSEMAGILKFFGSLVGIIFLIGLLVVIGLLALIF